MNHGIDLDPHDAAGAAPVDLYAADFIVDKKRKTHHGKLTYLYRVRWTGYTEADDTWEPIENLSDALLSEFEESVKQHRTRPHSTSLQTVTPLVTWSDMMQILGLCPVERLPKCLRPHSEAKPPLKLKCVMTDSGQKQITLERYFSSSIIGHNKQPATANGDATPEPRPNFPLAPTSSNIDAAAGTQSDRISCSSRPRLKQATPSRSALANVIMNC